ncbi:MULTISPECIES: hypothetical protein [unclassified Serratia (in: enterobacteria)]|uniref:hypothetical protein n=1 Tax=unclassified Serratia (in: enterobacteria) TaxID=2647522 RepID=UPI0004688F64|nr:MULTISPECIES: hypothetical protein [unclassified Serratia (in: enterobacteria)]
MNKTIIFFVSVLLLGCVERPTLKDDFNKESGDVKIYSTTDIKLAQSKADMLCGHHSFYLKLYHESNIELDKRSNHGIYRYIPFQCDVYAAARAGNQEAEQQTEESLANARKQLSEAKQHQYEAHKAYAKKYGGDSYSVVNPDGSIEAHSFDSKGRACHSDADQYGSQIYCD